MTAIHYQRQVCLQAWLHCEDALMAIPESGDHEKASLKKIVHECADICLGMLNAIRNKSANTERIALLCVGICEECAEACENLPYALYKKCADACRRCADALTALACRAI